MALVELLNERFLIGLIISVDMEELRDYARGKGAEEANDLNQWDINFWSERLRESNYDFDEVGFSSIFLSICLSRIQAYLTFKVD